MGSPSVDDDSPETGGSFTLSATVSNDAVTGKLGGDDAALLPVGGRDDLGHRHAGGHGRGGRPGGVRNQRRVDRFDRARRSEGTYYFGACVDAVDGRDPYHGQQLFRRPWRSKFPVAVPAETESVC